MLQRYLLKILICDMSNAQGALMRDFLISHSFKNATFEHDITEVKGQIYHKKPDVIISGNHLWNNHVGIRFILEYKFAKRSHLIISSDNIDDKILKLKRANNYLHLIKSANGENELIAALINLSPKL